MKRIIALIGHIVLAVMAFAVVVLKTLSITQLIPAQPILEATLLLLTGVVILIESILAAVRTARRPAVLAGEKRVEKTGLALLKTVADGTGIDILAIGVSVYIARPPRVFRWRPTKLDRILRLRLNDHPQPTAVTWIAGKGTIGLAWESKTLRHMDWTRIAKRYAGKTLTEQQFGALRAETRQGFTLEEFLAVVAKYAEILAVPIWDEPQKRCVGILAIDVPLDVSHANFGRALDSASIREVAATSASVLSAVVGKR